MKLNLRCLQIGFHTLCLSAFCFGPRLWGAAPVLVSELGLPPSATPAGDSMAAAVSPDGRFVLFGSTAPDLVVVGVPPTGLAQGPRPVNLFLRDRQAGTTTLVSVSQDGKSGAHADCLPMGLSTNGQFVLFATTAGNLVAGDTNESTDIFLRDLHNGITLLVSASTNGVAAAGTSTEASMTPDGRWVAFTSEAPDLVAEDTNGIPDVFVREVESGTTRLVSVGATPYSSSESPVKKGASGGPCLTPDGKTVVFVSTATNLVHAAVETLSGDDECPQIYRRDLQLQATAWVSRGASEIVAQTYGANLASNVKHAVSEDGRYVAFLAFPPGAAHGVLVRFDRVTDSLQPLYTNAWVGSETVDNLSALPMSSDGARIAFVAQPASNTLAVAVWDAGTGRVSLASLAPDGEVPLGSISGYPAISKEGAHLAFFSNARLQPARPPADGFHLYLRDLSTGQTTLCSASPEGGKTSLPIASATPLLTSDARRVFFSAPDGSLVAADRNQACDVFVREVGTESFELVSVRPPELPSRTPPLSSSLNSAALSADGRLLVFTSSADQLASGDTNGSPDVFARDLLAGATKLISVGTNGGSGSLWSAAAGVSADGTRVVFSSMADDLAPGDTNQLPDVFVRDLRTETTLLVSVKASGQGAGARESESPLITRDGQGVIFYSAATDLTVPPASLRFFYRDLKAGTTEPIGTLGAQKLVALSRDDRRIAYLAGSDNNPTLFIWDTLQRTNIFSSFPFRATNFVFSPDSRRLAYGSNYFGSGSVGLFEWETRSNKLIAAHHTTPRAGLGFSDHGNVLVWSGKPYPEPYFQVYLYDLERDQLELVSRRSQSAEGGAGDSLYPAVSPDGRFIAFRSAATDLAPGASPLSCFIYDRAATNLLAVSGGMPPPIPLRDSLAPPLFSPDGKTLYVATWTPNLAAGDFNHAGDILGIDIDLSSPVPTFRVQLLSQPGQCTLFWSTREGMSYKVEVTDHLGAPVWNEATGSVVITGNQGSFVDSTATATQRFYRVLEY